MSDFGLQIKDNTSQTIIKDKSSLALKIGHNSGVLAPFASYTIGFSSINNTKNIELVWNSDAFVSPYAKVTTRGSVDIWNRFAINTGAQLKTNILSVGVGNDIPITDTYGIYVLDSKGTQILNSQNKMLIMVSQFSNVINIGQLILPIGADYQGWLWTSVVDISDLDWRGPERWVSINPIRAKYIIWDVNTFLFVSTVFYMDNNNLYLGDYYVARTTSAAIFQDVESFIVNVMLFSEGN